MKKETVYMVQKVTIEYSSPEGKKKSIRDIISYPNSTAVGNVDHKFRKSKHKVKVLCTNPLAPSIFTAHRIYKAGKWNGN